MMSYTYSDIKNLGLCTFDEEFLKKSSTIIYKNKVEFDEYKRISQKINAIRSLRSYLLEIGIDGGLKNCKEIIDLQWDDKLPNCLILDRQLKLKTLSIKNMICDIVEKMKDVSDEELTLKLMELSFDELSSFYATFSDKLNK